MALVLGTNCGFVSSAPSSDPGGTPGTMDGYEITFKVTSPAGNNHVTEIGWWQDATSTAAAAYSCAMYTHDSDNDCPETIIGSASTGQSITENTAGWYKYTGLNIDLDPETVYWIGFACANTGSALSDISASTGQIYRYGTATGGSLTTPWPHGRSGMERLIAVYAVFEGDASSGLSIPIVQAHYRRRR